MSDFHFLRPYWLLALIPLALLTLRLFRLGREGGDWRRICDPELLPYILVHDAGGKTARRASWLFTLGGLLAIAALAGPVWERLPAPAFRNEAALVIALDLSRAMDAADIKPSRLDRARFKIADILNERKDGLTALLVYSGDAFTVTPLTDDAGTINSQLSALSSDLMPTQGSRTELALELAGRLLRQSGLTRGDVLLITNGVNLDKASATANKLASQGYRVSVLGAGTEEGAPTPLPEGGFLQDSKGNIVITKLAAPTLRQLAEVSGGLYRKLATDNSDLSALLAFFGQKGRLGMDDKSENGIKIEQWREQGPWLLLLLLPISALAFRRGSLLALFLLALPLPERAHALEWQELWQTRDQRASSAFQSGDHARAAETFDNPSWKAAAQYRAGQFEDAAKTLREQNSTDARYNLGNALARQGRYPQAIAAYDEALKLDPKNEDARFNKDLIEKAMKDQQQQKDKNQSGKEQGQGQQKQGERKEGQKPDQGQDQKQSEQSQSKDGDKPKEQAGQPEKQENEENQDEKGQGEKQANEQQEEGKEQGGQEAAPRQAEQPESEEKPTAGELERKSEDQQANEQWLRRIPDDPGGLLRRKFEYQYKQRQGRRETAQ